MLAFCMLKVNPVFVFHHVNAFEEDGQLVVDVSAYPDASIVYALYLKSLREGYKGQWMKRPNLLRYRIPLDDVQDSTADIMDMPTDETGRDYECLAADFEMPTINYDAVNGRPYRYAYGLDTPFGKFICKVDVVEKTKVCWYPGEDYGVSEGYFVAAPAVDEKGQTIARNEDEGVVISVITATKGKTPFMVILDATTFTEIARATLPFSPALSIHGNFVSN